MTANRPANTAASELSSLSYLIVSGGTGANSIATAFGPSPAFVLPVSDDGGSSSEILRCFGGPSIGDIRSRLTRLIPLAIEPRTFAEKERLAIFSLMSYRFPADSPERFVRALWMEIVEGRSPLWTGIGEGKKECIRAFLVHFQTLCLRRAHKRFSFRNFSIGNGFLTGARDLFGSLPSAIFLFKSVAGVDAEVQVIPVIHTNQTITIAAQLLDGETLVGQCTISHPAPVGPLATPAPSEMGTPRPTTPFAPVHRDRNRFGPRRDSRTFDTDAADVPLSPLDQSPVLALQSLPLPLLTPTPTEEDFGGNIAYRKGKEEIPLSSRIERIFYINLYGQEIYPTPNLEVLEAIQQRDVLVYSCGSLYTSIVPCLALRGLATAIASSSSLRAKVLLLNSTNDRETPGYSASEYVSAILSTLRSFDHPSKQRLFPDHSRQATWDAKRLITHVVYLEGAKVGIDEEVITVSVDCGLRAHAPASAMPQHCLINQSLGIKLVAVPRDIHCHNEGVTPMFTVDAVEWAMGRVMADL